MEPASGKNLKPMFLMALFSLALVAVLLGTATYAWFTNNSNVGTGTATGRSGTANMNLLIGTDEGSLVNTAAEEVTILQVSEGDMEKLLPVSTADLNTFLYASGFDAEGRASAFTKDENENKFYHGRIYLRMDGSNVPEGSKFKLYLDNSSDAGGALGETSEGYLLNASRLGLKFEEGTPVILYFAEDGKGTTENNTVVDGVEIGAGHVLDETGKAVDDPAEDPALYTLDSSESVLTIPEKALAELNINQTYPLDIYFYLEGCDEDCVGELSTKNCEIHLAFYAVAE